MNLKKYLSNCFLLLIPLILWNIVLVDYLPKSYAPEVFWNDIPNVVAYSESILRVILFALPIVMVFSLKTRMQKTGFALYCFGLLLYCSSWMVMIISPESSWSTSLLGFMAPAYTTIIFFVGIGMIGNRAFFTFSYLSVVYICLSILFVLSHSLHTYIVFQRL